MVLVCVCVCARGSEKASVWCVLCVLSNCFASLTWMGGGVGAGSGGQRKKGLFFGATSSRRNTRLWQGQTLDLPASHLFPTPPSHPTLPPKNTRPHPILLRRKRRPRHTSVRAPLSGTGRAGWQEEGRAWGWRGGGHRNGNEARKGACATRGRKRQDHMGGVVGVLLGKGGEREREREIYATHES